MKVSFLAHWASKLPMAPAAALLALTLTSCEEEQASAPPPTPEVAVAQPLQQTTQDWDSYTGRIQAIEVVEVRSRVSGYIERVAFSEGAIVQAGDLLFEIDPRPYEAELARAEAELERARASAEQAKTEFARAQTLRNEKVISAEQYDARATAASQGGANVRSAEAAVATARLSVEYCHITAPVTGRAGLAQVTVGNLIQPGGQVLTTVVSQDPMFVYMDVDENAYLRYQELCGGDPKKAREMPILLGLSNEKGYPHEGRLDFFDNRVDPNTGTIRMRGVFDNKSGYLTPGLFARVRVPGSKPYEGLLLPDSAVGTDQTQKFVLTAEPGEGGEIKVVYNKVELGPLNEGMRVIKSGLDPGKNVILSGFHAARPGTVIKPRPEKLEITEGVNGEPLSKSVPLPAADDQAAADPSAPQTAQPAEGEEAQP